MFRCNEYRELQYGKIFPYCTDHDYAQSLLDGQFDEIALQLAAAEKEGEKEEEDEAGDEELGREEPAEVCASALLALISTCSHSTFHIAVTASEEDANAMGGHPGAAKAERRAQTKPRRDTRAGQFTVGRVHFRFRGFPDDFIFAFSTCARVNKVGHSSGGCESFSFCRLRRRLKVYGFLNSIAGCIFLKSA